LTVGCSEAVGDAACPREPMGGERGLDEMGRAGAEVESALLGEAAEVDATGERRVRDMGRAGASEAAGAAALAGFL
jgi:hypothetical protein